MKPSYITFLTLLACVAIATGSAALAQDSQPPVLLIPLTSPSEIASRAPQARETLPHYIDRVSVKGPAQIVMKDQASFELPKDYLFVPDRAARVLLTEIDGARPSSEVMGLIFSKKEELGYILFEYYPAGYVDADKIGSVDLTAVLGQVKQRTEAHNSERLDSGNPAIRVTDWLEKPAYDPTLNRLTWSIVIEDQQASANGLGVNADTVLLGRNGYFRLLLVTNADSFEARRPEIVALLSDFRFTEGNRYGDFDSTTDRVANCDLEAVLGGCSTNK